MDARDGEVRSAGSRLETVAIGEAGGAGEPGAEGDTASDPIVESADARLFEVLESAVPSGDE